MSNGIAGIVTGIKYARSDRKHGSKHHASEGHKLTIKRYHRAIRREGRKLIAEES